MMFTSPYAPVYAIYGFNVAAVIMAFVGAAYVTIYSIKNAIGFNKSFYFIFGNWSAITSGIAGVEFLLVFFW